MEQIAWENLPFDYFKTDYNIRCYYRNENWGELEISSSEYIDVHISATAINYGQEAFEGMKAFKGKDEKIRVFRWQEHAKRFAQSAKGILLKEVPAELFKKAIFEAVRYNQRFVPPYGSGAALYIRPILIGLTPHIKVSPANECLFVVFVSPVGPYFKEGFKTIDLMLTRQHDRAAPLGTGNIKVGGNYASSLKAIAVANEQGCANVLFLDPKEKQYIEECAPANFFAIKNNTYITPESNSVLPSITNRTLACLAEDMGMKVEKRTISIEELSTFEEVGACGTAAIISPVGKIKDNETGIIYTYSRNGTAGPVSEKLYKKIMVIQVGDEADKFGWTDIIRV